MSAMRDLTDTAAPGGHDFLNRLRQRAFLAHERGEFDAAESAYQRILERSPGDFEVRQALGTIALQNGKHRWAVQLLSQVAQDHDSADVQSQLGTAFCGLLRLEDALRCFERAIAAQFDHMTARINRAQVLHALGRLEEAAAAYARTIELGLDTAEVHTLRGVTLGALGRTEESVACFDRALALQPGYVPALVNLGTQLRKLSSVAEALARQQQENALDARSFEALVKSAAALLATHNFEAALEAAECAIALRPDVATEAHQHKAAALAGIQQRQEATHREHDSTPSVSLSEAAPAPETKAHSQLSEAAPVDTSPPVAAALIDAPPRVDEPPRVNELAELVAELPQQPAPATAVKSPPTRLGSLRRLDWSVLLGGAAPTVASCILSAMVGSELARAAIAALGRQPMPVVAAPIQVRAAPKGFDVEPIVTAHLFGQVQRVNQDPATASPSTAALKLTGTLATGDPRHGIAIIGDQAKSHVYSIGESLDGASLWEVFQDHVILERNGSYESLSLPRGPSLLGSTAPPAAAGVLGQLDTRPPIDEWADSRLQTNGAGAPLGIRVVPGKDRARFMKSGLVGGDIVVAVNGMKFDSDSGSDLWKQVSSGSSVTVLRRGVLKDITLNVSP
jgi:type II secretion system protein C